MSLRTVLRFALAAFCATSLVSQAVAQVLPIPVAPMPRQDSEGIRLNLPTLGPRVLSLDYPTPLVKSPGDHEQLFSLSVGLFGGDPDVAPMPRLKSRVIVCSDEEVFEVETPTGVRRVSDSTHDCPAVTFKPVPMPRAIVEVIGNIEFGIFEDEGFARPVTIFRPAPLVRSPRLTSMTAIEPTFTWNYRSLLPPPMPRGIVEVIGEENPKCHHACPIQIIQSRQVSASQCDACAAGSGGWWLDGAGVPQPAHAPPRSGPPYLMKTLGIHCRQDEIVAGAQTPETPASCCATPGKLSGTWYRDLDYVVISATFVGDELKLCMTQNAEGAIARMTLTAHYAITKEGVVHGVITGADVDVKSTSADGNARATTAMTDGMVEMHKFVDCPLSFRVKSTSIGVMVSNLRVAVDGMNSKEMAILCGIFRHAVDGMVPTPRAMNTHTTGSTRRNGSDCSGPVPVPVNVGPPPCMPQVTMPTPVIPAGYAVPPGPGPVVPEMVSPPLPGETSSVVSNPKLARVLGADEVIIDVILTPPMRQYLHQQPQLLSPGLQPQLMRVAGEVVKPLPTGGCTGSGCFWSAPPLYSPARPANVPLGEFDMMSEVFGQMLGAKTQPRAEPAPVPPPVVTTAPVPPMVIPTPPRSERPR